MAHDDVFNCFRYFVADFGFTLYANAVGLIMNIECIGKFSRSSQDGGTSSMMISANSCLMIYLSYNGPCQTTSSLGATSDG